MKSQVYLIRFTSLQDRDLRYLENEQQNEKWMERMRATERERERRRIVKGQAEGEEEEEESRVAEKETGFRRAFAIVPDHRACVCTVVMGCQEQTLAARALYTNTIILLLSRVRSYRFANPPWTHSLSSHPSISPQPHGSFLVVIVRFLLDLTSVHFCILYEYSFPTF